MAEDDAKLIYRQWQTMITNALHLVFRPSCFSDVPARDTLGDVIRAWHHSKTGQGCGSWGMHPKTLTGRLKALYKFAFGPGGLLPPDDDVQRELRALARSFDSAFGSFSGWVRSHYDIDESGQLQPRADAFGELDLRQAARTWPEVNGPLCVFLHVRRVNVAFALLADAFDRADGIARIPERTHSRADAVRKAESDSRARLIRARWISVGTSEEWRALDRELELYRQACRAEGHKPIDVADIEAIRDWWRHRAGE